MGSNPTWCLQAGMMELVVMAVLDTVVCNGRESSSLSSGIKNPECRATSDQGTKYQVSEIGKDVA